MGFVQRRIIKGVMAVVSHPWWSLTACGVVLVAAVLTAYFGLSLSTDQNALLTPKLPFFKEYLKFDSKFPENEAYIVVVKSKAEEAGEVGGGGKDEKKIPAAKRWIGLADAITDKFKAVKDVARVDSRVPTEQLGAQGLMFAPWNEVKSESAEVARMKPLLDVLAAKPSAFDPTTLVLGKNFTERFLNAVRRGKVDEGAGLVRVVAGSLDHALSQDPKAWKKGEDADAVAGIGAIPDLSLLDPQREKDPSRQGYYVIDDESKGPAITSGSGGSMKNKMLIISIYTHRNYGTLADVTEPLKRMREAVEEAARAFPEFDVGITGRPALEADEMATSDRDTRRAEILGLSLVFVMLWIFLRNIVLVIIAEVSLGVGIGWTFGWAALAVGRLNLLSLVFVVALIGIGMDYLIQILIRYRYEKQRYTRKVAIWARVFKYVSPPISTACLGAAGAFLVSNLTDFQGAAELGIIAGGGLLLCLLTGYTLMPALLTVIPHRVEKVGEDERYAETPKKKGHWRLLLPIVWVIVALGGLWVSLPPEFNPDLLKLQSQQTLSVRWVHSLPTWYAVVMTHDLNKLAEARKMLAPPEKGPDGKRPIEWEGTTIRSTDSILEALDKQKWLFAQNGPTLGKVAWNEPPAPTDNDLKNIAKAGENLLADWTAQVEKDGADKTPADWKGAQLAVKVLVERLHAFAEGNVPAQVAADTRSRLGQWQQAFLKELQSNVAQFVPQEVHLTQLPATLRDHLVSHLVGSEVPRSQWTSGQESVKTDTPTYALYVYPTQDLWDTTKLQAFVDEVEIRTPHDVTLTGIAIQLYHSTQKIHDAFLHSAIYALLLIVTLVFLDLRKFGQTLLAISVLGLGLPMLLLMMWIWRALGEPFGIPGSWNFANFFALPILIGAGHEYGVFMVHRYRETIHDPRRVWGTWDVSDKALLLCAIVTTCSFGFLMLASHRGLASLGWVMAVGSACIYTATIVVLRPILKWRLERRLVEKH